MLYFKGIFYSSSLLLGVGLTYWIMMSKEFNDPPSKISDPRERGDVNSKRYYVNEFNV